VVDAGRGGEPESAAAHAREALAMAEVLRGERVGAAA
jgi:hypothetical protein